MKKAVLTIIVCCIMSACSKEKFVTYHFFSLGTIIDITIQEKYADYLPEINKYINQLSYIILADEKKINTAPVNEKIYISKETIEIYKNKYVWNDSPIYYNRSTAP